MVTGFLMAMVKLIVMGITMMVALVTVVIKMLVLKGCW